MGADRRAEPLGCGITTARSAPSPLGLLTPDTVEFTVSGYGVQICDDYLLSFKVINSIVSSVFLTANPIAAVPQDRYAFVKKDGHCECGIYRTSRFSTQG